jgi:hypothetical protein
MYKSKACQAARPDVARQVASVSDGRTPNWKLSCNAIAVPPRSRNRYERGMRSVVGHGVVNVQAAEIGSRDNS